MFGLPAVMTKALNMAQFAYPTNLHKKQILDADEGGGQGEKKVRSFQVRKDLLKFLGMKEQMTKMVYL